MTGDTPSANIGTVPPLAAQVSDRAERPSKRVRDAADLQDPTRLRLCVVTRRELPPAELLRFVASPDGVLVPDLAHRLPGRGVWVSATREAVGIALKRGLFAKSLKQPVQTAKDLVEQVEKLLALQARQALSLANKAGLITVGFSKVETAIERGVAVALISASDASADGTGKLARKFKAIQGAAQREAPVIQDLSSAE